MEASSAHSWQTPMFQKQPFSKVMDTSDFQLGYAMVPKTEGGLRQGLRCFLLGTPGKEG